MRYGCLTRPLVGDVPFVIIPGLQVTPSDYIGGDTGGSGQRRRVTRVRANLTVVLVYADGQKVPARIVDVSVGGMFLRSERTPGYGEQITVVVRLDEASEWFLLPAAVRWFAKDAFGVEFSALSPEQRRALDIFITRAA
jgi:c-di-GMP-binding flagellar brake protein YcgR